MRAVTGQQEVLTWPTEASWAGQGLLPRTSSPTLLAQYLGPLRHLCQKKWPWLPGHLRSSVGLPQAGWGQKLAYLAGPHLLLRLHSGSWRWGSSRQET